MGWKTVILGFVAFGLVARATKAQPEVLFEDATIGAGLDHLHWQRVPCFSNCQVIRWMIGSAAAGDFDNDGWTDLYVTRMQAPNLLFRNLGDGTFEEVGAVAGVSVVADSSSAMWGDVDDDGDLDLLLHRVNNSSLLFLNDGPLGFREVSAQFGPGIIGAELTGSAFGDYDLDGDLDLHIVGWNNSGQLNRLFRNLGGEQFVDLTVGSGALCPGMLGFSSGFADMDGDGWVDLVIAADFETSRLLRNLRNGAFADITAAAQVGTDENGMGSAIGDVDNDGDLDWFVTSIYDPNVQCTPFGCNTGWRGGGNRLYLNNAAAQFTDGTDLWNVRDGAWGWGASFLDFDNDGDLDLTVTNGQDFTWTTLEDRFHGQPARLWRNDGGVMTDIALSCGFEDYGFGKGLLVFDYDRDGDQDVFIVNHAGRPKLFRNQGGNQWPWLQVELRGRATNFFGLGAVVRVQVEPDGPWQMRLMAANSNFMGQNELAVHFGLGEKASTVHAVRVEWPVSGLVQILQGIAANQRILIEEPTLGDHDGDLDVDADDYTIFRTCLSGPQSGIPAERCARGADLRDFSNMQVTYTGLE